MMRIDNFFFRALLVGVVIQLFVAALVPVLERKDIITVTWEGDKMEVTIPIDMRDEDACYILTEAAKTKCLKGS